MSVIPMVKFLDWLDKLLVVVAVAALVIIMLLTTVSVFGRYFFAAPIPDDLVMSEMLIVFVAFLPLGYVQARREHVFVTIFTDWMPNSPKVVMETIGVVIGFIIFTTVAVAVFTDFHEAWKVGAYTEGPLELPEWPSRFIVFFGLAIFAIRLFIDAIMSIYGLYTGTALAAKGEVEHALEQEIVG